MTEKITPVTEDEIDNIRVTLDLDDGSVECKIITIFEVDKQDYIALLPLDKNGNENANGDVISLSLQRGTKMVCLLFQTSNQMMSMMQLQTDLMNC